MHYDDEGRQYNFLTGLVLGLVVGTGIALLARIGPAKEVTRNLDRAVRRKQQNRPIRDLARNAGEAVRSGAERARARVGAD